MPDLSDAQRETAARAVFMADTGWPAFMWPQVNDEQKARCRKIAEAALAAAPQEDEGIAEAIDAKWRALALVEQRCVALRREDEGLREALGEALNLIEHEAGRIDCTRSADDVVTRGRALLAASPVASRECDAMSAQGTKCAREVGHKGCHERYVDGDGRRWWGDARFPPPSPVVCACGHMAHWHSRGGEGDCEHDGECKCREFTFPAEIHAACGCSFADHSPDGDCPVASREDEGEGK